MTSPRIGLLAALITFSVVPVAPAEARPTQMNNLNQVTVERVTTNVLPTVTVENTIYTASAPTVTIASQESTPVVEGHQEAMNTSASHDAKMTVNNYRIIMTGPAQAIYKAQ